MDAATALEPQTLAAECAQAVSAQAPAPLRARPWHNALIDMLIAQPRCTSAMLGTQLGLSPVTIRRVMSSDMFREALALRRNELIDPLLLARLEENLNSLDDRMSALLERSLEVMQEKMEAPTSMIDANTALKAAEFAAKGLAIGGFAPKAPPPPLPPTDSLNALAHRLTAFLGRPVQDVTDVPPTPAP